jgi:hypothetical protein
MLQKFNSFNIFDIFKLRVAIGARYDITSNGGQVREGESFTLGSFGDLTGVTGVTIDGVSCTSVVVADSNSSLTANAPSNGVRYGEQVAIRIS